MYRKRYPFIYDGILDPQICKRRAGIRIWTGYGLCQTSIWTGSCSLRNLHRCVFLFQTISVLKYLIPADRNWWNLYWDSCSAMLDLAGGTTVYLSCGVTDLRKSYNGLAAIIKLKFHLDPYSRCMFAFCNRRRTSIKILQWDGSGFWSLMKRLDRNAFHWPDTPDELRQVTLKEWWCHFVYA